MSNICFKLYSLDNNLLIFFLSIRCSTCDERQGIPHTAADCPKKEGNGKQTDSKYEKP